MISLGAASLMPDFPSASLNTSPSRLILEKEPVEGALTKYPLSPPQRYPNGVRTRGLKRLSIFYIVLSSDQP